MKFEKVHACGNDFICVEGPIQEQQAIKLCDRYHGIGADGIMSWLGIDRDGVVQLAHWDPDGSQSFCLNGTRSWLSVLAKQGLVPKKGKVCQYGKKLDYQMNNHLEISCQVPEKKKVVVGLDDLEIAGYTVDFGDHFILETKQMNAERFKTLAQRLRHHPSFPAGVNVHWVQKTDKSFKIISFERGVEGFTMACGSGILSSAAVFLKDSCPLIRFEPEGDGWIEVLKDASVLKLYGPTEWIYRGELCSSFGSG